jgi:hypothetical protein
MNLLRKYFVPVFQASDPPGANADPPVVVPDPALTPEPPAEPPAGEKTVPVSVMVREITPLRAKVRETEAELARRDRTIAEQNELLSRLQKPGEQAPPARQPAPQQPQPDEVDRRATELLFRRDAQQVSETGLKTYGQGWVDAVNALNAYGVNSDDFVSSVIEIDRAKAHEIMHAIAQDGEKAIALANMTPARRIAEITRMAMQPVAQQVPDNKGHTVVISEGKPAKTVSKAPAPPPPVDPSASKVKDWRSDDASDDEFTAGFNETIAKRAVRR